MWPGLATNGGNWNGFKSFFFWNACERERGNVGLVSSWREKYTSLDRAQNKLSLPNIQNGFLAFFAVGKSSVELNRNNVCLVLQYPLGIKVRFSLNNVEISSGKRRTDQHDCCLPFPFNRA